MSPPLWPRAILTLIVSLAACIGACAGSAEPSPTTPVVVAETAPEPTTSAPEAQPFESETPTGADEGTAPEEAPHTPTGAVALPARELSGYSSPRGSVTTIPVQTTSIRTRPHSSGPSTVSFAMRRGQLLITLLGHRSSCGGGRSFREARLFVGTYRPYTLYLDAEVDDSRDRCLQWSDQELELAAPAPGEYIVRVGATPRVLIEIPEG